MDLPSKIFLAGFMGTGKSEVGRRLADKLGYAFADTDALVEKQAGKSIPDIFAQQGEKAFRRLERQALAQVLQRDSIVVALGGGAVCFSGQLKKLKKSGLLVLLQASPENILKRVQKTGGRPLLAGPKPQEKVLRLLERRDPYYSQIPWKFSTDGKTPAQVAAAIRRQIKLMNGALIVSLGARTYPLYFQRGGLKGFNDLMKRHVPAKKAVLITDTTVDHHYGRAWARALRQDYKLKKIVLPDGERHKNLKTVQQIYQDLVRFGVDRKTPLIALGGGVMGDLVGFAAASYLRGVPFVQVPTTLLSQVDSSIGGKTGVDLPQGKNLVGAFYQPRFVLIDEFFLKTLPKRQVLCGMAEVIKYGAIFDGRLFKKLEENMDEYLGNPGASLEGVIRRCCELKAWVVEQDERETLGLRSQLNFGHTLGHAIESLSGYRRYTHGEAIAMGMAFAAEKSVERAGLSPRAAQRVQGLLEKTGLPTARPKFRKKDLEKVIARDKKRVSGDVNFVYLKKIGQAVVLPTPLRAVL